jgi:hypothetical protein
VSILAYVRAHRGLVLQWFAVLAGPSAWSIQFIVSYNVTDTGACTPAASQFLASGGFRLVVAVVSALAAAVAALGLVVSYRCWRQLRGHDPTPGERASWLAVAGMMSNGLFLLMILGSFLPLAFFSRCIPSPA